MDFFRVESHSLKFLFEIAYASLALSFVFKITLHLAINNSWKLSSASVTRLGDALKFLFTIFFNSSPDNWQLSGLL